MQSGNFLPWINIYAVGAILIVATVQEVGETQSVLDDGVVIPRAPNTGVCDLP